MNARRSSVASLLALSLLLTGAVSRADVPGHQPGLRDQWQPQTEHDARLQQPVRIEILGRAAAPALALLSQQTGVSLQVAPENLDTVGERKLTVIAQGCSLKTIMVQIPNALQECHWDVDLHGKEPVYLLHRNGGAEAAMVELSERGDRPADEQRRPEREARVELARQALRMTPEELSELAKTDPMLAAWVKDPERRAEMELFFSLPPAMIDTFLAEGTVEAPYASLPSHLQAACQEILQSGIERLRSRGTMPEAVELFTRNLQHPENVTLCYRDLEASADGMFGTLRDIVIFDGGVPAVRTTGGDRVDAIPPRLPSGSPDIVEQNRDVLVKTGTLDATTAETVLAELAARRGQEAEQARNRKRAAQWHEPRSPGLRKVVTLPFTEPVQPVEVQRFIAKESGLSVVSDYFTSWRPLEIPEEARTPQPLWRLLYLFTEASSGYDGYVDWSRGYVWEEAGDCLVFHYSAWFERVPRECPESLLAAYREKAKQQGTFTLDDVAAFAAELQRCRPTHPVLRDKNPMVVPRDLMRAGLPADGSDLDSPALLLYASLTTEQREKARSEAGLPYDEMTPAQQEVLRHGGILRGARWLPEAEITHAVYRIKESTGTSDSAAQKRVDLQVTLPSLQTGTTLWSPAARTAP